MNGYLLDEERRVREVPIEEAKRDDVAITWLPLRGLVSTVFLGLDARVYRTDAPRPLVFETTVFGGLLDMETERYATEEEALRGHRRMVRLVRFAPVVAAWRFLRERRFG